MKKITTQEEMKARLEAVRKALKGITDYDKIAILEIVKLDLAMDQFFADEEEAKRSLKTNTSKRDEVQK